MKLCVLMQPQHLPSVQLRGVVVVPQVEEAHIAAYVLHKRQRFGIADSAARLRKRVAMKVARARGEALSVAPSAFDTGLPVEDAFNLKSWGDCAAGFLESRQPTASS